MLELQEEERLEPVWVVSDVPAGETGLFDRRGLFFLYIGKED